MKNMSDRDRKAEEHGKRGRGREIERYRDKEIKG